MGLNGKTAIATAAATGWVWRLQKGGRATA